MKRAFASIGSFFFRSKHATKESMSGYRYFPNNSPDFQELEGVPQIPQERLTNAILSISDNITSNLKPIENNGEDGLYLGAAGIAFTYYHLSKCPTLSEFKDKHLSLALEYINPALKVAQKYLNRKREVPAFLLGNCGVYAVASAIFKALGDKDEADSYWKLYQNAGDVCKEMKFLNCGSDELFVGRSGYICGALWLADEIDIPIAKEDIHDICRVIINSGRKYSHTHRSPSPLMYAYYDVEYLGAGHGLCSILQILMTVPGYLDSNPDDAKDVKVSVDYLLSLQDADGNFPCATDEIRQKCHELVHWCHGAPGIVYLMAKAYLVWGDKKYLKSCEKVADLIWSKGLLKKGPGLCHGVAGNGYVFLLLYRLTNETKYLHRAIVFAEFMESDEFKQDARVPDNPYSLYEGIAGTACFLSDLTYPSKAAFPFSDVF